MAPPDAYASWRGAARPPREGRRGPRSPSVSTYAVLYGYYGMSHGNIVGIPKDIAGELMSPAHTKGLHKLLDLNSYATRKLILEAAKRGRVCGDVQIIKLLRKRADFHTVDVTTKTRIATGPTTARRATTATRSPSTSRR